MRILQVIPSLEEEASGGSYFVSRLSAGLADLGHSVSVMSVGGVGLQIDPRVSHARFRKDLEWPLLRRLWFSEGLRRGLEQGARDADVIHTNSLWTMPNVYPGWAAAAAGTPMIFSPHGTLGETPLRISRRVKAAFWRLIQGSAVRSAACHHATCQAEYQEIRRFGISGPVAIIPIGIDIPEPQPPRRAGQLRRILYLSRIHPKKALPELLHAWARLFKRYPDWELRIVGPDELGHRGELERLSTELGLQRVTFAPPAFGDAKAREYGCADVYVLASHHENFGITVAEALAAGTPVIVSPTMPWGGVVAHGCGWQTPPSAPDLAETLHDAMSQSPAQLTTMGRAGRRWMTEAFSWKNVAPAYEALYAWAAGEGPRPDTVRLD